MNIFRPHHISLLFLSLPPPKKSKSFQIKVLRILEISGTAILVFVISSKGLTGRRCVKVMVHIKGKNDTRNTVSVKN